MTKALLFIIFFSNGAFHVPHDWAPSEHESMQECEIARWQVSEFFQTMTPEFQAAIFCASVDPEVE